MQLLAQHLPRSWEALGRARAADDELGRLWSEVVRDESIDERVITGPDGRGTLLVSISWPPGMRSRLTGVFRELVDACWAALDAAVEDSVHQFGNRHRLIDATGARYFAVAPDPVSMDDLLATRCLDGLPTDLFGLVMSVQQFGADTDEGPLSEPEPLTRARSALGTLLDWTTALDDGARLTAWATPVEPQVHVEPPVSLTSLNTSEPGPVEPDAVVATYTLNAYAGDDTVHGQVGTYIDLALSEGFEPTDQDDTLSTRIRSVLVAVASICLQFAHRLSLDAGVPGLRVTDNDDSWVRVDGPSSGWTAAELEAVRASELGLGVVTERQFMTLVVDTGEGIFERVVRAASPLNSLLTRGRAAEAAALSAAATWGLPDFVMRPKAERTSSGVREISDGLLVVGEKGLVLQSKAREGEVSDDLEKERRWVRKHLRKALKQIDGTHRRLRSRPTHFTNGRGRSVVLDGAEIAWAGVAIIDHPLKTDADIMGIGCRLPFVVVTRDEWEFLFEQLKSTAAVVDYVHRVAEPVAGLGGEAIRYYELAEADAQAPPNEVDPWVLGGRPQNGVPRLPKQPAGHDDPEGHALIRTICEDIALSGWSYDNEFDRTRLLGAIDGMLPGERSETGRHLIQLLEEAARLDGDDIIVRARTILPTHGEPWLGFMVVNQLDDGVRAGFESWVMLRLTQRRDVTDWESALTVGVLLTPRRDGYRDWDTTVLGVTGELEIDPEEQAAAIEVWGSPFRQPGRV